MTDCTCPTFPASLGNVTFGANVGFNTVPTYTLDLVGADTASSGLRVGTLGYTNLPPTVGTTPGVILNARGLGVVSDGASLAAAPSSGVGIAVDRADAALGLRNNSGPALVVEAGRVGLGTTTPGYQLDVAGTIRYTTANSGMAGLVDNDNHAIRSNGVGAQVFANNWGIASQGWIFRDDANGVDRVTIQSAGNVGIGTASPAYPLDVAGTARVSGGVVAGTRTVADAGGCYYA